MLTREDKSKGRGWLGQWSKEGKGKTGSAARRTWLEMNKKEAKSRAAASLGLLPQDSRWSWAESPAGTRRQEGGRQTGRQTQTDRQRDKNQRHECRMAGSIENLYGILSKEVTMDPLGRQKIQAGSSCLR